MRVTRKNLSDRVPKGVTKAARSSREATVQATVQATKQATKRAAETVGPVAVRAMAAAAPLARKAKDRVVDKISPPKTGWKLGPISVGTTDVVVEPVGNSRRRTTLAVTAGALVAYLLDPAMGRTRRAKLAQRSGRIVRRGTRIVSGIGRGAGARAAGLAARAKHIRAVPKDFNDPTLQQKIQSRVLRADNVGISVDVASGIVTLRGTCDDLSDIRSIERAVRKTEGVLDVINLLHEPGTPAPNVQDSLRAT